MAIALTSGVFIYEKSEGLLDRSLVAGIYKVLLQYFKICN